jgi:hypothetical protein
MVIAEILELVKGVVGTLPIPTNVSLILFFAVFLIIGYKVFKMLIHILGAAAVGAAFPFVANNFFGMDIPITLENILSFVVAAVSLVFLYMFFHFIYKIIKTIFRK